MMNTRFMLTFCTALVFGGALITGSVHALEKADEKTPINDTWLTAKTKIALAADSRVKGRQIDVETTQGVVLLRGKVDSDAAKQASAEIAKMLDGVKSVKNDLEVVAPAAREAVGDKDDAITTHVKEQIAKDTHLKKANIAVQTNAGVVSLTGEVRDLMTSGNASWTARQVAGVKSVKNDLTVKE
jgi:hyperosmotically inducible periplasmic protein